MGVPLHRRSRARHRSIAARGLRLKPESLEARLLLAGDPIKINFQTGNTIDANTYPELDGYIADSGDAFGNRGNGFTYGWLDGDLSPDAQSETRNRNNDGAPDERYDTLNHLIKGDDHSWQIEVPNGVYDVRLVMGDPSFTDQVNDITLTSGANQLEVDDPDGADNWDDFAIEAFQVTSGTIRVSPRPSGSNQKIAFAEITPVAEVTVPEVTVVIPVAITAFSARLSGRITDNGNELPNVTIHYGTSDGGTNAAAWDSSRDFGTKDDLFDATIDNLVPSTSYFVRAEVENSAGSSWSPQSFFFSTGQLDVASVVANAASNVTATSAVANGRISSSGGQQPEVVVYWGTSDAGTNDAAWQNSQPLGVQSSAFSQSLPGLADATTYFYRFAATNDAGTVWSDAIPLTTLTVASPQVTNRPATSVDGFSASINGRVTDTGNDEPAVRIYWGATDGGTDPSAWDAVEQLGNQPGDFGWTIAGLDFDSTYYYRAFAENSAGGVWASESASFRTQNVTSPIVENTPARSVSSTLATVGGNIIDFGNDAANVRLYYGVTDGGTNAASWDQFVEFPEEFGSYETTLTSLQAETNYFFRSLATNAAGSSWAASSESFTTPAAPTLLITELLASNNSSLTTRLRSGPGGAFGEQLTPDWIEIYNPTDQAADLSGLHLTDDAQDRTKWAFPAGTTLGAGQYLIVFASGENVLNPELDELGNLHANFKLSTSGEYLAITASDGDVLHEYAPGYPTQRTDISFGFDESGEPHFYAVATPGAANSDQDINIVKDTSFSVDRGFYTEPFTVDIETKTPGATIVFTIDGSEPSLENGTQVIAASEADTPVASVTVTGTTTLRAAAFKEGYDATNIDTHTYLFLDNVLQQSQSFGKDGSGLPSFTRWGHSNKNGDWAVDPDIVNHADPDNRLTTDDLKSVPTISLTLPWENMFASRTGIYIAGTGSPRAVSIEQILGDGSTGFQIDGSVQIQGGSSTGRWKADKLSMRLKFTEEFGPTKLENPIFGPGAADRLDSIVLDAVLNFGWHHPSTSQTGNAKFIQDQFVANLQNEMGGYAPHARYHHIYINGLYWGMYYVHERPDSTFAADYLGGDKDDYDVMKHNQNTAVDGTRDNYRSMLSLARRDLSSVANYEALAEVLDVEDFARYMLLNIYVGNTDWAHQNWYASYNRESPDGKWRFHSWDAEHVLKSSTENVTNREDSGGPTEVHQNLLANDEYRAVFADAVQKHMFHDGVLTPDRAASEYQALMDEIDRAIVGESARWGDNRVSNPYTRESWLQTQNNLLRSYFPNRTGRVLTQLRADGLYPSTSVPTPEYRVNGEAQHGGYINQGDTVTLVASGGTIYFTVDGSDPRETYGAVSPTAQIYNGQLALSQSATLRARLRTADGDWSPVTSASFYPFAAPTLENLAISELNYNPHESLAQFGELNVDSDEFEFIEFANHGDTTLELAGVQLVQQTVGNDLEGVSFTFPQQTLAPGQRTVVVANQTAFESRYGTGINVAGEFNGNLADGGELITVVDSAGNPLHQFEFNDTGNWPGRADGAGSSLEVLNLNGDFNAASNYRNSIDFGGSPGAVGSGAAPEVVINEVLTHTDLPLIDQIELHNLSNDPIDLNSWYLSDSRDDLFAFRISGEETVIAGNGYLTFDESQLGFGFKGQEADDAWLVEADASGRPLRFVDRVEFEAAQNGQSLGRWPNGGGRLFPMTATSFGAENTGPVVPTVMISEVHYHPATLANDPVAAADLEFFEVTNINAAPASISSWRVDRAVDFDFPQNFTLAPNESVVVVGFDPVGELLADFKSAYQIADNVRIIGPYSGRLDNNGERLELQRPEDIRQLGTGYVLVDRVGYDDESPWPIAADGLGSSLQRLAANRFGDFASSWDAIAPTAGFVSTGADPTDLNGDGVANARDIDLLCQSIRGIGDPIDLNQDSATDLADLDTWLAIFGTDRGDANLDRTFNSSDLIRVFSAGQYEDGIASNSGWQSGDWNCDGDFDTSDLVAAFRTGGYSAAATPHLATRLVAAEHNPDNDPPGLDRFALASLAAARDSNQNNSQNSRDASTGHATTQAADDSTKRTDRAIEHLTFDDLFW